MTSISHHHISYIYTMTPYHREQDIYLNHYLLLL